MPDMNIWSGWIQLGFAGFAFAMLGVLVWLVKNILRSNRENNKVISANTAVIQSVFPVVNEVKMLQVEMKDKMLESPCMLPEELKDLLKPTIKKYFKGLEAKSHVQE